MEIVPFRNSYAIVNSRGQIVTQSPNVTQATERYLENQGTGPNDPIRIVVASAPSKTSTKI